MEKTTFIPTSPAQVAKALLYVALTVVGILKVTGNAWTPVTIGIVAIGVLGTIPVYLLRGTAVKTLVTAIVAGIQFLLPLLATVTDFAQVRADDWVMAIVTGLAAVGVAVTPNAPPIQATIDSNGVARITALNLAPVDQDLANRLSVSPEPLPLANRPIAHARE